MISVSTFDMVKSATKSVVTTHILLPVALGSRASLDIWAVKKKEHIHIKKAGEGNTEVAKLVRKEITELLCNSN